MSVQKSEYDATPMTPTRDTPAVGRRFRAAAQAVLLAIVASYVVVATLWFDDPHAFSPVVDGVWRTLAFSAVPALCALRISRDDPDRTAWIALTIGLILLAGGGVYWAWFVAGESAAPTLNPAKLLWLGCYPFLMLSLYMVVSRRTGSVARGVALDGLLVGLGTATVAAALIVPRALEHGGRSAGSLAPDLAFGILDILLVAAAVSALVLFRWRPPAGLWWLAAGIAFSALADWTYLVQIATGEYVPGGSVDSAVVAGATPFALAPGRRAVAAAPRSLRALPVAAPLIGTGLAVSVMILDDHVEITPVASYLAAATAISSMARLALAFVDARRAVENARLALTDDLTGLPNRRYFYATADRMLERAGGALLLVDLDRFKDVNDSLGHLAGDELLGVVAQRLRAALASADLLARLGGDEFAVVVPGADEQRARVLADSLLDVVFEPVELEGLQVRVDASVGIAVSPDHGDDVGTLMRHADIAMYRAKRREVGAQVYRPGESDPAGRDTTRAGMVLLEQVRAALTHDELAVHYQPQVEMRTGRIVAVEALVRWNHPEHGLLYPAAFLPIVQQYGLMHRLTAIVLARALDDAARWSARGFAIPVAVNLFPPTIGDGDLPDRIAGELARRHLPPTAVRVEITEDFLVGNLERARRVLGELHDMGVQIAIDDFGTGYSALSYLRDLPIDEVKLDRSFVVSVAADGRSAAIVRAVIDLAATLNVTCVAEGVENAETYSALAEYGCHVAQGYFCGRPMPFDDLLRLLAGDTERTRVVAG